MHGPATGYVCLEGLKVTCFLGMASQDLDATKLLPSKAHIPATHSFTELHSLELFPHVQTFVSK